MRKVHWFAAAGAAALLVPLSGCSGEADTPAATAAPAEAGTGTLAAKIGSAPGLTTISGALSEAGLADVFDGPGSYTVLAPDDDAFAKLGDTGSALTEPANRAELVAVLRGHILPGHLTPQAIKTAIGEKKGPVSMRNLAGDQIEFSLDGDAIIATGSGGIKARIDGAPLVASNGVVLPLDALIKSAQPETIS
ncbi:fasciclin domain-containing protein [Parafrankia sp. BMG5.11]|uniref:fasciclin domain-containing protein n=1 Tax=Parafrankia sp. BMG5.11 TaxID=222540 RepID=UPI0014051FFF|nr:fasciclin domain-containing protein [Parafrankia sp. BMG5.11]